VAIVPLAKPGPPPCPCPGPAQRSGIEHAVGGPGGRIAFLTWKRDYRGHTL